MRMLLHSPKDVIAGLLAAAAVSAILANALFLQAGRHPSPMFGNVIAMPAPVLANPLPRPRPAEAATRMIEPLAPPEPTRSVEVKTADPRSADPRHDAMTNLVVKSTGPAPAAPRMSRVRRRRSRPAPRPRHHRPRAASPASSAR